MKVTYQVKATEAKVQKPESILRKNKGRERLRIEKNWKQENKRQDNYK